MTILIIDDSKTIRRALKALLEEAGYDDVLLGGSAEEGMELLKAQVTIHHRSLTDLILMDIIMPGLDGLQAVRALKDDPELTDIPIIVVSALDDEKKIEQAFEAGAIDFINKPVRKLELLARVRSVLRLKEEMDQRKIRETELAELNKSLENANQKLREISNTDGLTGIPNRRLFDEAYLTEWRRCRREKQPLSVVMGDIDFFKAYNDRYGHLEGDQCLRTVAQALLESTRRPGDMIARYGGEEFVALLPNTESTGAVEVAEKMRLKVLTAQIEHGASSICPYVTISLGAATICPEVGQDPSILLDYADRALYTAKSEGRNQVISIEND